MQEGDWEWLCDHRLTDPAFTGTTASSTDVTAKQVKAYTLAATFKDLYRLLYAQSCALVGLWYRADVASEPRGQLVCVTAIGNGQWGWLPLSHKLHPIKAGRLALTNLQQTGRARRDILCHLATMHACFLHSRCKANSFSSQVQV